MLLPVIQSKLQIPVVKDEYIRRATLTKKMKKIPEFPLTILHSGAGYGKSTALALYMRDEKINGCWYTITKMDDDILPFLVYLTQAIRRVSPDFGKEMYAVLETMDRYIRDEEINLLCSLFINEILAVPSKIILVLDDFHHIEHSHTIQSWMEKLIQHIPANLHIVISTRSIPAWKQLAKMRICGQLLEIAKEDLVLTIDEMDLLLTELYGVTIEPAHLRSICQMTEGWIIALCMIAQQISSKKALSSLFAYSTHSLQDLFHYLAMEVFSKQPPLIKQFLEQTSVLEEIETEMAVQVTGMSDVAAMLEEIRERNLFIQMVGPNQYRYHALFKEFLEKQFQAEKPRHYRELHEQVARSFEKKGKWEEALYHYKKINDVKAISAILKEHGSKMIDSGKLESLVEHLKHISEKEMERDDFLWYLKAEVHRYRSHYLEAEKYYQKAYCIAEENLDYPGMSKALEGQAKIYLDTIQPQMAEKLLYEAIAKLEKDNRYSHEKMGKLHLLLSENLLNSGKAVLAEKVLIKAKHLNENVLDGNLEARLYLRTGHLVKAKNRLETKKKELKADHPTFLPQSHRETELLLSLIEVFSGGGMRAKELAQEGIQQGVSLKAPMVEACGWIRMGHAVQVLNKYELDLAEQCYDTALEIMDEMGVNRGKAEPLMGLCILYGTKREFAKAIEAGSKALQETEKACDVWLSGFISLCMGITCVYHEKFPEALQLLEKTESLFNLCDDSFGLMVSKFWLSYLFYLEKKQALFHEAAHGFLKGIQRHHYEFFLEERSLFGPRDLQVFIPLLIECTKEDIQKEYVMKILQHMGMAAFDAHPGYSLRVQTLGQFKIWLGEREVGEKAWQREKAKELFQLLLTKNTFISKEEITQILWPNQDKQSADRDFKVALNALHHVLEPKRKARAAPFFVIRDGMFYGFNPLAVIELDTRSFQGQIQKGLNEANHDEAGSLLEKGLSLYQGEYLPERRYDDWCAGKRESMLVYFLRGAEKMAQLNIDKRNFGQAIYWCEKIIECDPTWEEAYRLLMYCYFRKNNRPQAIKWYQKCTKILKEELGVTPLEPTRNMYKSIIESEAAVDHVEQP